MSLSTDFLLHYRKLKNWHLLEVKVCTPHLSIDCVKVCVSTYVLCAPRQLSSKMGGSKGSGFLWISLTMCHLEG